MPEWLHRTNKSFLHSVPADELPEAEVNYIEGPDMSAVTGQPSRYWVITGDVVSLADQGTRDAIDAADLVAFRDAMVDAIDELETYSRAFALVVLDEFNLLALKVNEILDAIDNASNLSQVKTNVAAIVDYPQRTAAQLKSAVRNRADT